MLFSGLLKRRCFEENSGITFTNPEIICKGVDDCPGGFICGKQMCNPQFGVENFDDVFSAFMMVFQVTTMEGWAVLMVDVQNAFSSGVILYFVVLVFIGNFFLLNLLLAVIIVKFNEASANEKNVSQPTQTMMMLQEVNMIFPEVDLHRSNDFEESLEFARMKLNLEDNFLQLSNIEKARIKRRRMSQVVSPGNEFKRSRKVDMYLRTLKIRPNKVYGADTFNIKKPPGQRQFWSQDLLDQLKFYRYADKEGDFPVPGSKRFGTGENLISSVSPLGTPKVGHNRWESNLKVQTSTNGHIGFESMSKGHVGRPNPKSGKN